MARPPRAAWLSTLLQKHTGGHRLHPGTIYYMGEVTHDRPTEGKLRGRGPRGREGKNQCMIPKKGKESQEAVPNSSLTSRTRGEREVGMKGGGGSGRTWWQVERGPPLAVAARSCNDIRSAAVRSRQEPTHKICTAAAGCCSFLCPRRFLSFHPLFCDVCFPHTRLHATIAAGQESRRDGEKERKEPCRDTMGEREQPRRIKWLMCFGIFVTDQPWRSATTKREPTPFYVDS